MPDHVYCLFPSISAESGIWRNYTSKPAFINAFPFWQFLQKVQNIYKFNDTYSLFHIQVEFGEELEGDENNNGGKKEIFSRMEAQNEKLKIEYKKTCQDGGHRHTPATVEMNKKAMEFNGSETDIVEMKGKDEVRCSTCFVSHFPRPNTLLCKGSKLEKKNKGATNKHSLLRLRGGARNDKAKQIVDRAIANGKIHGINLHPGVENLGNGNCAFECVLDSINTRVI